jgi:hypothetical protein
MRRASNKPANVKVTLTHERLFATPAREIGSGFG